MSVISNPKMNPDIKFQVWVHFVKKLSNDCILHCPTENKQINMKYKLNYLRRNKAHCNKRDMELAQCKRLGVRGKFKYTV